ncbi:hypothetical protein BJ165DRAFT_1508647 [Panaeolus papilionaceus]|nr:hypothetical protein BJ165DRAFT_1508647 [Panaeolus papilionaceus]
MKKLVVYLFIHTIMFCHVSAMLVYYDDVPVDMDACCRESNKVIDSGCFRDNSCLCKTPASLALEHCVYCTAILAYAGRHRDDSESEKNYKIAENFVRIFNKVCNTKPGITPVIHLSPPDEIGDHLQMGSRRDPPQSLLTLGMFPAGVVKLFLLARVLIGL